MAPTARSDPTARVRAALGEFDPHHRSSSVGVPGGGVEGLPGGGDAGVPGGGDVGSPGGREAQATARGPANSGARHTAASVESPTRAPRLLQVPAGLRGGNGRIGFPAAAGLIAAVLLAALIFTFRVVAAERSSEPVPVPSAGQTSSPTAPGEAPGAPTAEGSGTSPSPAGSGAAAGAIPGAVPSGSAGSIVVVHVVGQVRTAGVVRLPSGSRVIDAIDAAGGITHGADLGSVNLARLLVDGEQVRVPKPGEVLSGGPAVPPGAGVPGGGTSGGGASGGGSSGGPVSLNTADLAALDTLPGVGPVLAGRILAWRTEHGRFSSVDELGEVSGIGEKLLSQLRDLVTL